jgi:O-acetyl-ADP-ribose deacetylase (regulator of RNase III)
MSNITLTSGDLFASRAQTLVNATNCQGVMGAGIARAFKERFPTMFEDYQRACEAGEHTATQPHFWRNPGDKPPWMSYERQSVLNIASTPHMGDTPKLSLIAVNLVWIVENYEEVGIRSLAVPALGCGIGGGDWSLMKPLLVNFLSLIDIPVEIYEPQS